jgi:hypothetical protein
LLLVLLATGIVAYLLGTGETERDPPPTSSGSSSSAVDPLTDVEASWCTEYDGRVANDAFWEYRSEGAPFLTEAERLGGVLGTETAAKLAEWRTEHPDHYAESCRRAFTTWAGRD